MITAKEFIDCEEWWRVRPERDNLNAMIEFAKFHVEASLKAATNSLLISDERYSEIEKQIINSYPLSNIQ